jgi:hypothetical protein
MAKTEKKGSSKPSNDKAPSRAIAVFKDAEGPGKHVYVVPEAGENLSNAIHRVGAAHGKHAREAQSLGN